MFSKKAVMIVGVIVFIAVNVILLSLNSWSRSPSPGAGRIVYPLVVPFQKIVTGSVNYGKGLWNHYFFLVKTAKDNDRLKKELSLAAERNNLFKEIELSNYRLRNLLDFQKIVAKKIVAAEVVGKYTSSWFRTIIIDKGSTEGVEKGLPVLVPEGIVGQVAEVSPNYSKVLLIMDRNSAVDGLIQESRARGIVKGKYTGACIFEYVLRKDEVKVGDIVITSGLDGVYPKGLRIGHVSSVIKRNAGIFQDVIVSPYVDFEKLEEVLVVLNPPVHEFMGD
ncbi:MAG: rod shape-determining protein MreC [Desulfobacterales bacterium]|jgi:rod shape-determining protein MreC|nr:rod shape-determining protein MreC [Desulfobacteraceae bacterium]MBT4363316.1 rod shape-determining protein MreC [Desulfobacteraceae bacterium]MBT7696319.1 rod shape-determining protein MreC [Desulfobacterales bacterium]